MNEKVLFLLAWAESQRDLHQPRTWKLGKFLTKLSELSSSALPWSKPELLNLLEKYPALTEYYQLQADSITLKPQQDTEPEAEPEPVSAEPPSNTAAELPDFDADTTETPVPDLPTAAPAAAPVPPTTPTTPGPREIVGQMAARARQRKQSQ